MGTESSTDKKSRSLGQKSLFAAGFLFAVVVLVVGFQNCTAGLVPEETDSFAQSLPFAYKIQFDQVSNLSCAGYTSNFSEEHFSYKVGAYRAGSGVSLEDSFKYETRFMDSDQISDSLAASTLNSGAFLQLGIRRRTDLYQLYVGSSTPRDNEEFDEFFGRLDVDPVVSALGGGSPVRSATGFATGEATRNVEGAIRFLASGESEAGAVRDLLNTNTALLSVVYGDVTESDPLFARSDFSVDTPKPYGVGFQLGFTAQGGANRVLSSISEIDLLTNAALPTPNYYWTCKNYRVLRQVDQASLCPFVSNNTTLTEYQAVHAAVGDNWSINVNNQCVVLPTANDQCYRPLSNAQPIDTSANCDPNNNCQHYLNVCYKVYQ